MYICTCNLVLQFNQHNKEDNLVSFLKKMEFEFIWLCDCVNYE